MGLSHLAIVNAHPDINVVAVCDSSTYVLGVLGKYTGLQTFSDYDRMLDEVELDAVVIATPTRSHVALVRAALERDIHAFCEKPLTLDPAEADELARLAEQRGLVTQVGYHNRYVAAFREVKELVDAGVIGTVTHGLGEAYGPVVLKPKGMTWRSQRNEGGGCLYDYAAHPIDLLQWYLGAPTKVGGTVLNRIFSRETEDEVYSTIFFEQGRTAQLSVNWSDDSHRKMTTRITLWGTKGRIYADRQECQVYLREDADVPEGYSTGWNVRYTTELTEPVGFYLRGEEYSAQIDAFVGKITQRSSDGLNAFGEAAVTDGVIAMMLADVAGGGGPAAAPPNARTSSLRERRRRLGRHARRLSNRLPRSHR